MAVLAVVGISYYNSQFSLSINGVKIDKEEFLKAAEEKKYDVTSYFSGKSGVSINRSFWNTQIDGEIPAEKLADAALEELKEIHAAYGLAEEKGYVEDGSYQGLVERWEAENKSRADKVAKGEPVYGLSEFTLELYREYEMDSIQKQYCADLGNEGMEISDEDRAQYYEEKKDQLFRRDDDIALDYIKIPYEQEGMDEGRKDQLHSILTQIYKDMDAEHSLAELAGQESQILPYLKQQEFSSGEASVYSRVLGDILDYAWELKTGESTAVLDENGALYLVQCSQRSESGYIPIDEVQDHINKALREERYDEIVKKRAEEAQVEGEQERIYFFMKKHIEK